MLRRSPRSASALDQTKQELARQESELRDQMEKLRLLVRQIESRQFRHVSDVEVGCFGHKSKVEMIKQPNHREQNGDHKSQK